MQRCGKAAFLCGTLRCRVSRTGCASPSAPCSPSRLSLIHISVGVYAKDGFVATDGWLNVSRTQGVDFCRRVYDAGVRNVIYTDIARDGAMQGTNLSVYETLAREVPGLGVTASGGISSLSEIRALAAMGTKAAIVGKAVYTGALALPDVLAAAGEE